MRKVRILIAIANFFRSIPQRLFHDEWGEAWDRLQVEKKANGYSRKYWDIWSNEVCPAYRKLTARTPERLRHPYTKSILDNMDNQDLKIRRGE